MLLQVAIGLWVLVALIVLGVYAYFALSTRQPANKEEYYQAIGRLRRPLFLFLLIFLVVMLALTAPRMPYPKADQVPDKVVHVMARQFQFALSEQPIENEEDFLKALGNRIVLPLNQWIEFRVSSFDVNHNFGLYDPKGRLIAQTQAMPGYVNRLFVRLEESGRYTVLCLEYCGLSHHIMRANLQVGEETAMVR